ncbi:MAG TPA: class I SAM-dependent methyltransferase [Chthoniobacter sp.]|nr:class I SAM-dependent methyltransferase [Chthoniobacter sp.]
MPANAQGPSIPEATAGEDLSAKRKIQLKFKLRRIFGEMYVGKRMKRHGLRRARKTFSPSPGARVLEVGSEDGSFTEWFDRLWPQVTMEGLEVDPVHAEACAAWAESSGRAPKLTFRRGNLLDLEANRAYDLILCFDVLGYIADDARAITRLSEALRPGGRLVIHQPNVRYREFSGTMHHISNEESGKITEGHVRHGYSPEGLARLLEAGGLTIEKLECWHGPYSDLAHKVYRWCERPSFLRIAALPVLDLLWWVDSMLPHAHGNTVFAVARIKQDGASNG